MVRSFKYILTAYVFKGLAGCVRDRKRYHTNMKNDTKVQYEINDKFMYNSCSKKWCNKHDKTSQMEPTNDPQFIKTQEKWDPDINENKEAHRKKVGRLGADPL